MAKYDAFGREIGEDTLAGLGGGSIVSPPSDVERERPAAPVISAPPAEAVTAPAPDRARRPKPRRRRSSGVAFLLIALAVGVQLLMAGSDEDAGNPAIAPPSIVQRDGGGGGSSGTTDGAAPSTPASLLTPARFGRAMERLRVKKLGRLTNLRLAPDRINAQLLTADGRIRVTEVSPDLAVRTLATSGGGFGHLETFGFDNVRASAPQRLTRAAARRLRRSPRQVNYLVLSRFGEDIRWAVYFKDGRYAIGDTGGRIERVY